jgi:Flp pilus assembly protein TadB
MPAGSEPRDISLLRARRREADRRRRLLRLDLALGVLGAIVLLLATPGLAIAAVVAGVLLAVCVVSVLVERRRRAKR